MLKFFNLVTELIIKIVSLSFASIIFLYVISSKESWIYIIFAFPFVIINYILSKKFPNRFNAWGKYKDAYDVFLIGPVSIIIISTAFTVYIFNYFDPLANKIWFSLLQALPVLYEIAGQEAFTYSYCIIVVIVMLIGPFIIFKKIFKLIKKREYKLGEYGIHFSLFYICFAFLFFFLLMMLAEILFVNKIIEISTSIVIIILGFIPIHWFYEIFIGSIFKRDQEDKIKRKEKELSLILDTLLDGDLGKAIKNKYSSRIDMEELKKTIGDEAKAMIREDKEGFKKDWKNKITEIINKKLEKLDEDVKKAKIS